MEIYADGGWLWFVGSAIIAIAILELVPKLVPNDNGFVVTAILLIAGIVLTLGWVRHLHDVERPPTLKQIIVVDTESAATLATIEGSCKVDELENSIEVICSVGDSEERLVFDNASYIIRDGYGKVPDDYYRVEYPADTPSE